MASSGRPAEVRFKPFSTAASASHRAMVSFALTAPSFFQGPRARKTVLISILESKLFANCLTLLTWQGSFQRRGHLFRDGVVLHEVVQGSFFHGATPCGGRFVEWLWRLRPGPKASGSLGDYWCYDAQNRGEPTISKLFKLHLSYRKNTWREKPAPETPPPDTPSPPRGTNHQTRRQATTPGEKADRERGGGQFPGGASARHDSKGSPESSRKKTPLQVN